MAAYETEMVPWLWFLTLFSDCRIFQNKSVPDIVQKVFSDRGFSDYENQPAGQLFAARLLCAVPRDRLSISSPG